MSIDLTLDRIHRLFALLPTFYTRPTVHIAGTNGKGSVSALVSSILRASTPPLSVGRYNSPHLIAIHDCIAINNEPVDRDVYEDARAEVERINTEHGVGASSFELLTLTALLIFERANLDTVVIEVGMGGRLDATNVIPDSCIAVSALTAVDLDHQAFLGNTVVEIAKEKAGIARRGKPFVLGAQKYSEVQEVVACAVAESGGEIVLASVVVRREWDDTADGPRPPAFSFSPLAYRQPAPQPVSVDMSCFPQNVSALLPLYGEHQLGNLGIATSIVSVLVAHPSCAYLELKARITPATVAQGIKSVHWPGRLSFHLLSYKPDQEEPEGRPLLVLADGAHNAASATTLAAYIADVVSDSDSTATASTASSSGNSIHVTYILSLSHSPPKTPLQTLSPLLPPNAPSDVTVKISVALLGFTAPAGMPWVKPTPPSDVRTAVLQLAPGAEVWMADDDESEPLPKALNWAATKNGDSQGGLIVLAGSLYLVADFYRLLRYDNRFTPQVW